MNPSAGNHAGSRAWMAPEWPTPANVRAAVTTRFMRGVSPPPYDACNLGARVGDDPSAVAENRARLVETLALPSPPHWLTQVHGSGVARVDAGNAQEPQADAAITREPGRVLAILTADCLPVLFCADDGSAIAAAHAGWRGLSAGVLENTLDALQPARGNILAWLGPAIGPRSYEVGDEVRDAFLAHDPQTADTFAATRPGHWLCDLYALATQRLRAAGVARIFGGGFDTFADSRFYSYRRDGAHSGRFATLIWLATATEKTD